MRIWKQLVLAVLIAAAGFGFFQAFQMFVMKPPGMAQGGPGGGGGPPGPAGAKPPGQGGAPAGGQLAGQGGGQGAGQAGGQRPAGGGGGPGGPGGGGPTMVATAVVQPSLLRLNVDAVGTTLAKQAVEIVPLAAGRIVTLAIEPGKRVKAGDTLAELDKDIETANLTEAQAKLREAALALERAQALRRNNTIADAQFEQATSAVIANQAEVDRAQRRLADRVIRAPFDGITGLNRVEIGQSVSQQTVVTTLDDLSEVDLEFSLSEILYGRIAIGQRIVADAPAFPGRSFEGAVKSIDSRIDPASRAFKVRASIPNADLVLPAGMFMHLALVLEERQALLAPEEALLIQGGKSILFVVQDGKVSRREVETGARQVGSIEIVKGLTAGETIVTRGVQKLREGAPVVDAATAAKPEGAPGKDPAAPKPSGS